MTTAPTPPALAIADLLEYLDGGGLQFDGRPLTDAAASELIRLQAELECLRKELEARKPLPLSVERLDELWSSQRSFHGGEPLKMGHVEFARLIEVEYGVLGRIPMREENGGQIAPALVDKSPNLQEPLVDKTADLQDLPAAMLGITGGSS